MLEIVIPESEFFNNRTQEFFTIPEQKLSLEHSLVSISKWEAKWKKPFLGQEAKSQAEVIDYIRCMTITQNPNPGCYNNIPNAILKKINDYIEDSMTATWFSNRDKRPPSRKIITSEVIYSWMISLGIPMECQKWHLNRLLTLIRVCDVEQNQNPKKMNKKEAAASNRALNAARQAKGNTRG